MNFKISFFIFFSLIIATSCTNNSNDQSSTSPNDSSSVTVTSKAKLEIIYFHTTKRCLTCNSVEDRAKELLEQKFKPQLDNGDISFVSLNIDEDANKAIASQYEVSFSTLLLINNQATEPTVTNFTEPAFKYAKNTPNKYSNLLEEEINKILQ